MRSDTLLVVDDEAAFRQLVRERLEPRDYAILEAASGAEAIRLASTNPPGAVLMDLLMPGMNGAAAAQVLLHAHPELPIILMSTDLPLAKAAAADVHVARILGKPFDFEELIRLLHVVDRSAE